MEWEGLPGSPMVYTAGISQGTSITYRFSIANNGPAGVTVVGVGDPLQADPGQAASLKVVSFRPDLQVAHDASTGWVPFRPFALSPGSQAGIEMQLTLKQCMPKAAGMMFGSVPVTFRVSGLTRHVWFQPDVQIDLRGTGNCPSPGQG